MAKIKETDYLFSTARVRSVENNMLSREKVEKMIDAKSTDDAMRILYDCDYGYGKEQYFGVDFEKLLTEEHKKVFDFIMSITPDINNFNIFLYAYDYHNLKVIMKSEYLGIDSSDLLVDTGSIDLKVLKYAVKERDFTELTENMSNALNEIIEDFPKSNDPQIIDLILDRYLYDEILKAADEINNEFIKNYFKIQIDLINLKTFVRLKRMNKSWNFFTKVFIKGGELSEDIFIKSYDDSLENFADVLFSHGYQDMFLEGIENLNKTGKFTTLEKIFDNRLIQYVKSARYKAYGVEPLVGYLIAKENEIKVARIIMAGKIAGIPSEQLRERMRETYV